MQSLIGKKERICLRKTYNSVKITYNQNKPIAFKSQSVFMPTYH